MLVQGVFAARSSKIGIGFRIPELLPGSPPDDGIFLAPEQAFLIEFVYAYHRKCAVRPLFLIPALGDLRIAAFFEICEGTMLPAFLGECSQFQDSFPISWEHLKAQSQIAGNQRNSDLLEFRLPC